MKIESIMSKELITVGEGKTLKFALELMKENNIRHLPVLYAAKATGILSERDIRFLEAIEKVDLEELKVSDAFTDDILSIGSEEDIKVAAKIMSENKIGCLLVQDSAELKGIVTWIDILKYISNN